MIVNKGKLKLIRALSPDETLNITHIWVTDDDGALAVTDTTAEFCDYNNHNLYPIPVVQWYATGNKIYFIGEMGFNTGNVAWTKIGIVDEDNVLIAQKAYTHTKSVTEQTEITYELEVTV